MIEDCGECCDLHEQTFHLFDGWISLLLPYERFCFIPSSGFIPDLATALASHVLGV